MFSSLRSVSQRFVFALVALSPWLVGCNSGEGAPGDDVPPNPVVDYTLAIHPGSVTLEWINPPEDFATMQIRRGDDAVTGVDDGEVVYEGSSTNSYLDEGLTNGRTYFYGFVVYDEAGNHSEVVQAVATLPAPGELVDFPDAGLAAAVRSALGLSAGQDIRALDLLRLSELGASGREIQDLTGLRFLVNLNTLDLSGNQLQASLADPVARDQLTRLANLRTLNLADNALTSMPNLATMGHLSSLSVAGNIDITSAGSAGAIPSLFSLDMRGTGVVDLASLASAIGLVTLNLMDTPVSDLTPLSGFTELRTLLINDSSVTDLSPLMGITSLHSLEASEDAIEDVSALALLPNLENINLANDQIHDLQGLVENEDLGVSDRVTLVNNPLLHEAVAVQIPALQGRGVDVNLGSRQLPVALVGVWHQPSVTVNGVATDAASFFEWDPDSVDMRLSLYSNEIYLAEELDAAGAVPYFDSGTVQVDGDSLALEMTRDNGTLVDPPQEVVRGTWSARGDNLELTMIDGADTILIRWTRMPPPA